MRNTYSLLLIVLLFISLLNTYSQCGSMILGNDTTLCEGQTIILNAGEGYDIYLWNNGSTEPTITVDSSGVYWCIAEYTDSTNMVTNGNFSNGNTGFNTDYVWGIGGPWGLLSEEGTYVTGTMASLYHTNFEDCLDHTTGDGTYMIVNGDTTQGENVWCQTVLIEPLEEYIFSSWFTSVNPDNPAVLEFRINDVVTEVINVSSNTCEWQKSFITWNSEQNFTAELCIVNQNTEEGGNDFGIDDISLYKLCKLTDTIEVTIVQNPDIALGNDTSLCIGQTINLDAGSGFESYNWMDGFSEQLYPAITPGNYSVIVTDNYGCEATDSIHISLDAGPEITLGNDTVICQGASIELSPGIQFSNYLWSDNTTLPYLFVSSSGEYSVQVTDYLGCTGEDDLYVLVSNPEVYLGNDSSLCEGDTLNLSAGTGYASYSWQDGSIDSIYYVTDEGSYSVEIIDQYGCINADEINIEKLLLPYAELGPNHNICSGDSVLLIAPEGNFEYFWNGVQGDIYYTVHKGGDYILEVVNLCGIATDQVQIIEKLPSYINLGQDTILHPNESVQLDAGEGFLTYLWQDGSTNNTFLVEANNAINEDPKYFVEIYDGFCKSSDTIQIEILYIWVPSVITPNNDFQNEIFQPDLDTWNGINSHSIIVFNRWGEKVWESDNFPMGWDGKSNGSLVANGTYFWVLEVFYGPTNIKQVFKGNLTIIGTIQ